MGSQMDILDRLNSFAADFDRHMDRYLSVQSDIPAELSGAIRYAALAPGKRIRPFLVGNCCILVGGSRDAAWPVAAAVECIHAFSLVHDDLPAMDNDDLRRGQPTCHKQFGEAMAILAGDALVVLAFELLARHVGKKALIGPLVVELSRGTGMAGMIGGQMADILGESQKPSLERTACIHDRKTGSLIAAACRMGALTGGASQNDVDRLGAYGLALGKAFQIADDLLDLSATADVMGKETGKDAGAKKQTYPACVGTERSLAAAGAAAKQAITALDTFDENAADLRSLAEFVVSRSY